MYKLVQHYPCWNERLLASLRNYPHLNDDCISIFSLVADFSPSSVAIPNSYKHFCLHTWLDNKSWLSMANKWVIPKDMAFGDLFCKATIKTNFAFDIRFRKNQFGYLVTLSQVPRPSSPLYTRYVIIWLSDCHESCWTHSCFLGN